MKYAIGKSSAVFIGEDSAIKVFNLRKKSIKLARGSYELCWLRETTCLERLKGKLHRSNQHTIFLSWHGS